MIGLVQLHWLFGSRFYYGRFGAINMADMELINKLSEAPVFKGCDKTVLENMLSRSIFRLRMREPEAYIAHKGDVCNDVMILVEGSVYTTMTNYEDDREIVIEVITAPLMLAPAFVYGEVNRLPVNIIAKTHCILLYIDKWEFHKMMAENSILMGNFVKALSDRCSRLSKRVYEENLQSLKERIVEYLKVHGRIDNIQWVARLFGVARPSLSRILSDLKDRGIVEKEGNCIILKKE